MAEAISTSALQDPLKGDDEDEYIVPKKKFRPVASGEGEWFHKIAAQSLTGQ